MRSFLAVIVLFSACRPETRFAPPLSVAGALSAAVKERQSEINLSTIPAEFPWEYVVFLAPYTPQGEAERALGFSWPEYAKFGLAESDSFYLAVFVSGKTIRRVEQIRRCEPDVAVPLCGIRLPREHSRLSVSYASTCPTGVAAN